MGFAAELKAAAGVDFPASSRPIVAHSQNVRPRFAGGHMVLDSRVAER